MGFLKVLPEAPLSLAAIKAHLGPKGQLTRQLVPEEDAERVFTTFVSDLVMFDGAVGGKGLSKVSDRVSNTSSTPISTSTSSSTTLSTSTSTTTNPSTSSALVTFNLPPDLIPSYTGIFLSHRYCVLLKHFIPTSPFPTCTPLPLLLLAGASLQSLRLLQPASRFCTQLRNAGAPLAQLSVTPTVCLTGSQVTLQLLDITSPLLVNLYLECIEEYPSVEVSVCQVVKQYEWDCHVDALEQIIPLAPDWEGSVEQEGMVSIRWRIKIKITVKGEGEFEVIVPLTLYKNKVMFV